MLRVRGLETFYGASQALFGVDLDVAEGEVATLMGRNGMGKTTTINSIIGIVMPRTGSVSFAGHEVARLPSFRTAKLGIGLVPEGRQVFPNLSVEENLIATAADRAGASQPWTAARVYALFPELQARRTSMGNLLSGGEQQMLAIGRALMTNPRLVILDEATEGLAPLIRQKIWAALAAIRGDGLAILVVDKNVSDLIALADRHHIIEKGRIVWTGSSAAIADDPGLQQRYLGV
jgi:branched-chain amino acid transport system ATP-binding protein